MQENNSELVFRNGRMVEADPLKEAGINRKNSLSDLNKTPDGLNFNNAKFNNVDTSTPEAFDASINDLSFVIGQTKNVADKTQKDNVDTVNLRNWNNNYIKVNKEILNDSLKERTDLLEKLKTASSIDEYNVINTQLQENQKMLDKTYKTLDNRIKFSQKMINLNESTTWDDRKQLIQINKDLGKIKEAELNIRRDYVAANKWLSNEQIDQIERSIKNESEGYYYRNGKLIKELKEDQSRPLSSVRKTRENVINFRDEKIIEPLRNVKPIKSIRENKITQTYKHLKKSNPIKNKVNRLQDQTRKAVSKAAKQGIKKTLSALGKGFVKLLAALLSNPIGWIILLILVLVLSFFGSVVLSPEPNPIKSYDPEKTIVEPLSHSEAEFAGWANVFEKESKDEFYLQYHQEVPSSWISPPLYAYKNQEAFDEVKKERFDEYEKYIKQQGWKVPDDQEKMNDELLVAYEDVITEYLGDYDINNIRKLFLDYVDYDYFYLAREWSAWEVLQPDEITTETDPIPEDEDWEQYIQIALNKIKVNYEYKAKNDVDEYRLSPTNLTVYVKVRYYVRIDDYGYVQHSKEVPKSSEEQSMCYSYVPADLTGSERSSWIRDCQNETETEYYQVWEKIGSHLELRTEDVERQIKGYDYRNIVSQHWTADYKDPLVEKYALRNDERTGVLNQNRERVAEPLKHPEDAVTEEFADGVKRTSLWEDHYVEGTENYDYKGYQQEGNEKIIKQVRYWVLRTPHDVYEDMIKKFNPENGTESKEKIFNIYKDDPNWASQIKITIDKEYIFRIYYWQHPLNYQENYFKEDEHEMLITQLDNYLTIFNLYFFSPGMTGGRLIIIGEGILSPAESNALWAKIEQLRRNLGGRLYGGEKQCTLYASYQIYLNYGIASVPGHGRMKAQHLIDGNYTCEKLFGGCKTFHKSSQPETGSIFSITTGPYGHTGYVEEVNRAEGYIIISDGNIGASQIREHIKIDLETWNNTYAGTIYYAVPD